MATFYLITFIISVAILAFYFLNWNKHFNRYFTIVELLIPLMCFGVWRLSTSITLQEAVLANDIIYIGGCFILPIAGLGITSIGGVKVPRWISIPVVILSALFFFSLISTEYTGLFYKEIHISESNGVTILEKVYGPVHTVFDVILLVYLAASIAVLIYCLKRSRKSSLRQIVTVLITIIVCVAGFFVAHYMLGKMEPTILYVIAQFGIVIVSIRSQYYFADDFVMSTIANEGSMGCMTFSKKRKVLGWNDAVEKWFPEVKDLHVDRTSPNTNGINGKFNEWFDTIDQNGKPIRTTMQSREKIFIIDIKEVTFNIYFSGYCISIRDDTAQQQLMEVMQKNSEHLIEQVFTKNETLAKLSKTFKYYVDPSIMNEIMNGADINLAGKEMDVVVLFADIRGFTTLTESLNPEETVHILNSTFELMTKCVMENHGTLDKFIGDCIMAFWNAPIPQEDSAYLACKTAREMLAGLPSLNRFLGFPEADGISLGIGVCAGTATVGNIGSANRMDYTAVGDTVNTASRLKDVAPANTAYITQSVIEKTDNRVKYTFVADNVMLKGKTNGIKVFSLDYVE